MLHFKSAIESLYYVERWKMGEGGTGDIGIFTVLFLLGVSLSVSFYVMWTLGKAEQNSGVSKVGGE